MVYGLEKITRYVVSMKHLQNRNLRNISNSFKTYSVFQDSRAAFFASRELQIGQDKFQRTGSAL
jgi:hypothetical protein